MSNRDMVKFGELALRRSPTSFDEESNDGDGPNGFSTIDLNGAHSPVSLSSVNGVDITNNMNGSLSTYTSFGEAIAHGSPKIYPQASSSSNTNQNQAEIKKSLESNSFSNEIPSPISMLSSTSIGEASNILATKTASTIETIKQWSKSAYKCTRQIVSEKLGKSSRTIDTELELTIEVKKVIDL